MPSLARPWWNGPLAGLARTLLLVGAAGASASYASPLTLSRRAETLAVTLACEGDGPLEGVADVSHAQRTVPLTCNDERRLVTEFVDLDRATDTYWRIRASVTTPDEARTCEGGGRILPLVLACGIPDRALSVTINPYDWARVET